MSKYYLGITTTPNIEEARKIAQALVKKKLVACVNIIPSVESVYWWEGKVNQEQECVLLMKTHEKKTDQLVETLPKLHSYSCPELILTPIEKGHPPYLEWIEEAVS